MKTLPQFKIGRDKNGNKVCKVSVAGHRAFSIQTNGNLPQTNRYGVCLDTSHEVLAYVDNCGTDRQRRALGI